MWLCGIILFARSTDLIPSSFASLLTLMGYFPAVFVDIRPAGALLKTWENSGSVYTNKARIKDAVLFRESHPLFPRSCWQDNNNAYKCNVLHLETWWTPQTDINKNVRCMLPSWYAANSSFLFQNKTFYTPESTDLRQTVKNPPA